MLYLYLYIYIIFTFILYLYYIYIIIFIYFLHHKTERNSRTRDICIHGIYEISNFDRRATAKGYKDLLIGHVHRFTFLLAINSTKSALSRGCKILLFSMRQGEADTRLSVTDRRMQIV